MAIHKVSYLALLLLFGMILLVSNVEHADAKICTRECDLSIAYGICPRAGINDKIDLSQMCINCCSGKKGCNYYRSDGTFICEGESVYVSEVVNRPGKPCTLNCDPRIAYGICPYSQSKRINLDHICTNCCAGKKGCNYFSADGTFICEGESVYVSEVVNRPGKPCTLNCDPRIAYEICPYSQSKRINLDRICTNCCAGKKGCNYFSADGTFICEGESEYVSEVENDL
ncbi:proteinase inhibitor type-2 TR8-like [Lycium barbarum]|uniref:proteinase inhibitor type-2 TR8-like n=1 Tax=Lycium barbarum TaxID=112863 RepID=UPI00293EFA37|nr:proteinase inhibitor type-2 TR8-like [Lycium barbarum]